MAEQTAASGTSAAVGSESGASCARERASWQTSAAVVPDKENSVRRGDEGVPPRAECLPVGGERVGGAPDDGGLLPGGGGLSELLAAADLTDSPSGGPLPGILQGLKQRLRMARSLRDAEVAAAPLESGAGLAGGPAEGRAACAAEGRV